MLRLVLTIVFLAVAAPPVQAAGETVRDRIVQELREDGYREIRISRTFLGRMRFVAMKRDARREIVVNPVNGVILRDYIRFIRTFDEDSSGGTQGPAENNGRNDDDEYDDEYDDDEYDDEYDDDEYDDEESDNSGHGSSNSGSGSSD